MATANQASQPTITDKVFRVSDLRPDPGNPNKHPEKQIAEIAASISEFGFIHRIIVRPDGQLVGGEGTLQAVARLGMDMVECRVVDGLSEAQYVALGLALNKLPTKSYYDEQLLADALSMVHDADLLGPTGYSLTEAEKLIKGPEAIDVREIATGPVADEFWISVRGPLAQQATALARLTALMRDLPDVTVDLGTITAE